MSKVDKIAYSLKKYNSEKIVEQVMVEHRY